MSKIIEFLKDVWFYIEEALLFLWDGVKIVALMIGFLLLIAILFAPWFFWFPGACDAMSLKLKVVLCIVSLISWIIVGAIVVRKSQIW